MCGFTQDNILYVSDSINKASIDQLNLRCAVSFGPVLIVNGEPRISGGGGWGIQTTYMYCTKTRRNSFVLSNRWKTN